MQRYSDASRSPESPAYVHLISLYSYKAIGVAICASPNITAAIIIDFSIVILYSCLRKYDVIVYREITIKFHALVLELKLGITKRVTPAPRIIPAI